MGENRLMADLYEENQRLKARIEELEEKHWNECGQIAHYDDELRKAKDLLKAAVDNLTFESQCRNCKHQQTGLDTVCKGCRGNNYEWRHADEALALIGGSENG